MSLFGTLQVANSALVSSQIGLHVAGNNIANANTPGYSRQTLELKTANPQWSGSGFFGKGVDLATVSRSHDAFLSREVAATAAQAAADETRAAQLRQLETVFATGEDGIGHAAGQFLNAFADYARLMRDSPRYGQVAANAGTAQGFSEGLQRAGYATDPNYADNLTRVINTTLRLQRAMG